MAIVECTNVRKSYVMGEVTVNALNSVSINIGEGEFVTVVGSSGSGKSTLAHIIGCVDSADSGDVIIDGTNITKMRESELAVFRRRKIGLIYQFYNLLPTLNVEQNIMLPMLLDKKTPDKAEFDTLVSLLGIDTHLKHYPSQLSGGQQQRVAIARSILYHPAILIADEPTGNLDKRNGDEIMELFKLSNKQYNQTIILITHDDRIAAQASRIVSIEDGVIVQ